MKIVRLLFLLGLFYCTRTLAADFVERAEVRDFIAEMHEKHNFDVKTLTDWFHRAQALPAVLRAMQPSSGAAAPSWRSYRERFVEPKHIDAGIDFWNVHAKTLAAVSASYGIPEQIVVAIIGVETFYGRSTGKFQTFSALTTLGFDYPPRADFFRRELEQLLLLARDEGRDPLSYHGSYAGAIGLPQFMPSSARNYAVDFDGVGGADLSGNPDDAIGSVARFLANHGWKTDGPVLLSARVSGDKYKELLANGISPDLTPSAMVTFGVDAMDAPEQPAALIELPTTNGDAEYRLGFRNFYALTRYNRSNFYAAAVFDLAQALVTARQGP